MSLHQLYYQSSLDFHFSSCSHYHHYHNSNLTYLRELQALDYLAIAVHELASMSERRTERLVNPALSELPAFLVEDGGLNSGFMLAHCTAASLGERSPSDLA